MNASWHFYQQTPQTPIRNPISGEFFSTEAVGNVTEALVREGIQNTLDARKSPDHAVKARIYISEAGGALPAARVKHWFESLWPHISAANNGLRNQPDLSQPCPFLVFEDFETTGLNGDPAEHRVIEGVKNHFLNFFRAEGHSDKGDEERGSWGVGKTVFPRTSRISTFLGLTVRAEDNKKLLLGRSVLKYHKVGTNSYTSDGYFGLPREGQCTLPTDDAAVVADFRRDFHLERNAESGLSIVVPWYELDGDEPINAQRVIEAVLRGFFYPILMGHLSVEIASPALQLSLTAASILPTVEHIGGQLASEMVPLIKFAEWAQTRTPAEFHLLNAPPPTNAPAWSADLVPAAVIKQVQQSLAQRQPIALKVPMFVRPRTNGPKSTFFNLFIEHSDEDREKPVFIREELIISDVKAPRAPQVRSLVIVEDRPIAALLRDAETPAHTQWNQGTSNFKDKYLNGPGAIKFVSHSVSELLRIINQAEQEPDPTITIDFFSVPAPPEEEGDPARRRKPRERDGGGPPPPPPPPPPKPRSFRIEKIAGGFGIRPGTPGAPLPQLLDIRVAYDVRRGNPLRKYHTADFDLGSAPIRQANAKGLVVQSAAENQMLVAVQNPDFYIDVTGFDEERDLYVKAVVKDVADVN